MNKLILLLLFCVSCFPEVKVEIKEVTTPLNSETVSSTNLEIENDDLITNGNTLMTRILPPAGYVRIPAKLNSFPQYLRDLPLKPNGTEVLLFDGSTKKNYETYIAVVDLPIGNKDLHQCADAIMRLRASYLWEEQRYEEIHFNLTNGFRVDYSNWMKGQRIKVSGNKSYWVNKSQSSNTYEDFWKYLELIFSYAGTLSLSKELHSVPIDDLKMGDVFIWGGSPGHAVLVVDVAINSSTGQKVFLLAQSYMPAQEIQILHNPSHSVFNPWYDLSRLDIQLDTPEWTFTVNDLKRF